MQHLVRFHSRLEKAESHITNTGFAPEGSTGSPAATSKNSGLAATAISHLPQFPGRDQSERVARSAWHWAGMDVASSNQFQQSPLRLEPLEGRSNRKSEPHDLDHAKHNPNGKNFYLRSFSDLIS